jgi:outer membrane protein OmpA-like peptidoglycan-associated protein
MYLHEHESIPGFHFGELPSTGVTCRPLEIFDGFDVGDYRLKPGHYSRLISIARLMPGFSRMGLFLRIEGHTDNSGPDRMNEGLSLNRASEVQSFLSRLGGPAQIDVVGVGEVRPRSTNATAAGRRQNRRVEIQLCQVPAPTRPAPPRPGVGI